MIEITSSVSSRVGIGGNLYIYSSNKEKLIEICEKIGKKPSSIYFNKKHECWTIRIKSKKHKQAWLCG